MTDTTATAAAPSRPPVPGGAVELGGNTYMRAADGSLTPIELVKAPDRLIDDQVRKIMGFAIPLHEEVSRFRQHTLDDVAALIGLLAQEYDARIGGKKGNLSITSYDGTLKVQLQVATLLTFGPELQAAKALVDEYLTDETAGLKPELRGLIAHAFNTDQEGKVNRAELFKLLRYEITDDRWQRAMRAIKDSIRPIGKKEYVRFYRRETPAHAWTAVTIDMAVA